MTEKFAEKGEKSVRKNVLNFIPSEADVGEEEIDAVMQVLNSEKLSSQDLLLPVYQTHTERDLKDVIVALEKVACNTEKLRD
jgi:dTDP-4-amino-4,6-dideoxygalactose transaminase